MIVADRAAGRQAKPDLRGGFRAVAGVEHQIFVVNGTAFARSDVAAVEAAGNLLL